MSRLAAVGAVLALVAVGCATSTGAQGSPDRPAPVIDDGSVLAGHAGQQWFLGEVPDRAVGADPSLPPVRVGLINQEATPVGSYPEVRAAVEAAVAWINAELGGVGGHPVELHTCITPFDEAASRSCAEELADAGVVAFVGGVDVTSGGSMPVVESRGLVSIGGIPATLDQMRSPNAFFFSGGDGGALAGFMAHAARTGRTRVALGYAREVPSFEVAARDYGAAVGRSLGLDVELVPYSIVDPDATALLGEAEALGADAVMVLAASSFCAAVMEGAADLHVEAQLYLTGACASDTALDDAGESSVGVLFNAEGRVDGVDVDAALYRDVVARYAQEPAGGAGTVGFRGVMNLYSLLSEVGPDATPAELLAAARASVGRPSFWGHPYTCDGEQVPGLPALCAPQQILFEQPSPGAAFVAVTDWIPTDALFATALEGRGPR